MKLIVVGPRGKMGKFITEIASQREGIEIVAGVGPVGRDYIGKDIGEVAMLGKTIGAPVVDDLESVIDNCDVIIDFSTVEMGMRSLAAARAHGKALICGSTGFTPDQVKEFHDAAADIPVMLAANTSKLVNIMFKLIQEASPARKHRFPFPARRRHSEQPHHLLRGNQRTPGNHPPLRQLQVLCSRCSRCSRVHSGQAEGLLHH